MQRHSLEQHVLFIRLLVFLEEVKTGNFCCFRTINQNFTFVSPNVSFLVPSSDVLSPAVVSLSDAGPHQIRVSWGPLQTARVRRYTVEYGAIPSGRVRAVTLPRQKNSTLLTGLEPNTQYLVTVSALYADGKERAMSVRTCTLQGTEYNLCYFPFIVLNVDTFFFVTKSKSINYYLLPGSLNLCLVSLLQQLCLL